MSALHRSRVAVRQAVARLRQRLQFVDAPEAVIGEFRAKQRQSVMRALPAATVGVVLCAISVAYTYWPIANHWALSSWMAILIAIQLRQVSTKGRFQSQPVASRRSLRLITWHAVLAALVWSWAPLTLMGHGSASEESFLLFICTGLCSCGVFTLVMVPTAATAWLLLTSGSLAISFAWRQPQLAPQILGLTLLYVTLALYVVWMVGRMFTARLLAEAESARQHEMVRRLLRDFEDNATDMLWQTDAEGLLLQPSPRFAAAFGVSLEQLAAVPLVQLLQRQRPHPTLQLGDAGSPWLECLAAGEPFRDVLVPLNANGELRWWSVTAKPFSADDGSHNGWRGVATDVTGVQRKNADLRFLAERDALTGLTNRAEFHAHVGLSMAKPGQEPGFTLVCLDIDHFKKINDAHGHIVGDQLLRETARRLLTLTRPKDTVARLGSDQFALLLPGLTSAKAAETFVARLQDRLHQPCDIDGLQLPLRVSIGMVVAPRDGSDGDELLSNADLALYIAKREGRGTYRLFRQEMGAQARRRQWLERDLQDAVVRHELRVMFQPQVRSTDGRIVGVEALVRWRHATLGEITPVEFIPIAEETGFIVELGAWVLGVACRHALGLPDEVLVSVNVSAAQIMTSGFPEVVAQALAETGLPAQRLELEITESVFADDSTHTVEVLHALHALGARIALDDFGTGYSSLAYLRRFPFDTLKIDKAFVSELLTSDDARAIVETIISLARTLRMSTVAEGVEEHAQAEVLGVYGCQVIQGYLMSRPLPAEDVAAFIAAWSPERNAQVSIPASVSAPVLAATAPTTSMAKASQRVLTK